MEQRGRFLAFRRSINYVYVRWLDKSENEISDLRQKIDIRSIKFRIIDKPMSPLDCGTARLTHVPPENQRY
jgi:hypothetical protein